MTGRQESDNADHRLEGGFWSFIWEKSQAGLSAFWEDGCGCSVSSSLDRTGVEAAAVAAIEGRADGGALSPSEPEAFTPEKLQLSQQLLRLPCSHLPNGRCLLSTCFAPDTMQSPSHYMLVRTLRQWLGLFLIPFYRGPERLNHSAKITWLGPHCPALLG